MEDQSFELLTKVLKKKKEQEEDETDILGAYAVYGPAAGELSESNLRFLFMLQSAVSCCLVKYTVGGRLDILRNLLVSNVYVHIGEEEVSLAQYVLQRELTFADFYEELSDSDGQVLRGVLKYNAGATKVEMEAPLDVSSENVLHLLILYFLAVFPQPNTDDEVRTLGGCPLFFKLSTFWSLWGEFRKGLGDVNTQLRLSKASVDEWVRSHLS